MVLILIKIIQLFFSKKYDVRKKRHILKHPIKGILPKHFFFNNLLVIIPYIRIRLVHLDYQKVTSIFLRLASRYISKFKILKDSKI